MIPRWYLLAVMKGYSEEKVLSGSKFELQKLKKIDEVDTLTDNYQDSSLELSHSRKRKRLNDNKEYSQIEKKDKKTLDQRRNTKHWTLFR